MYTALLHYSSSCLSSARSSMKSVGYLTEVHIRTLKRMHSRTLGHWMEALLVHALHFPSCHAPACQHPSHVHLPAASSASQSRMAAQWLTRTDRENRPRRFRQSRRWKIRTQQQEEQAAAAAVVFVCPSTGSGHRLAAAAIAECRVRALRQQQLDHLLWCNR